MIAGDIRLRPGTRDDAPRVAVFVSPHGFGHAARTSAVLNVLRRSWSCHFELFTTVPRWFFDESVPATYRYHEEVVDVGFRQRSALHVDLGATVDALERFLPFDQAVVDRLAATVSDAGCRAVLCDIAPLGVAVAEAAGIPSVVLESFTWGWLYQAYREAEPALEEAGRLLDGWLEGATVRLQARPVCARLPELELVPPVSRSPRRPRDAVRADLEVEADEPLTVVTMGGHGEDLPFLPRLTERTGRFLVTGAARTEARDNLLLFDNRTPIFMPDVLRAADAVVAKLGYGTVAEVWREGIPYAWVTRPGFPEMASLEAFARTELEGFGMTPDAFAGGGWIEGLDELRALPRHPGGPGGAERVAEVVAGVGGITVPA